jgi:CheY-like chemotaxis protein
MSQRKVLLIDDSEVTLQVIADVLAGAGYDVRSSTEVLDLGSVLGEWRPDVILTDVNMPGMSGVELCRRLKSSYETAHVPVVLYSALAPADLEVLARECEADAFLSKSSELEALPKELADLIDQSLF